MDADDTSGIDRLVEFGLSVAIAQQMTRSMNTAIENTRFPAPGQAAPGGAAYHAMLGERAAGPFSEAELTQLIATGQVSKATFVWRAGMASWKQVQDCPDVLRLVVLAPPPFDAGETA